MITRGSDYEGAARRIEKVHGRFGAPAPVASKTINAETVRTMHRFWRFVYRGRSFTIRTLGWWDGVTLQYHTAEAERLFKMAPTADTLRPLENHLLTMQDMLWRIARPWWRWRNPFRKATMAELLEMSRFCSEYQTTLPGLVLDNTQGSQIGSPLHMTSRTRLQLSRRRSRFGWRVRFLKAIMRSSSDSAGWKSPPPEMSFSNSKPLA